MVREQKNSGSSVNDVRRGAGGARQRTPCLRTRPPVARTLRVVRADGARDDEDLELLRRADADVRPRRDARRPQVQRVAVADGDPGALHAHECCGTVVGVGRCARRGRSALLSCAVDICGEYGYLPTEDPVVGLRRRQTHPSARRGNPPGPARGPRGARWTTRTAARCPAAGTALPARRRVCTPSYPRTPAMAGHACGVCRRGAQRPAARAHTHLNGVVQHHSRGRQ